MRTHSFTLFSRDVWAAVSNDPEAALHEIDIDMGMENAYHGKYVQHEKQLTAAEPKVVYPKNARMFNV